MGILLVSGNLLVFSWFLLVVSVSLLVFDLLLVSFGYIILDGLLVSSDSIAVGLVPFECPLIYISPFGLLLVCGIPGLVFLLVLWVVSVRFGLLFAVFLVSASFPLVCFWLVAVPICPFRSVARNGAHHIAKECSQG